MSRSERLEDGETKLDEQRLYGERYYLRDYPVPYERNEHWLQFFGTIAERVVADLAPKTALDAGCAMGLFVEQLVARGVDASGIDISEYAIANAPETIRDRLRVGSLTNPLDGRYDVITCIEVIEHLPPNDGRRAVANLCTATDRILFSSIPDGYEEPTHLNVQPPETWSVWFATHDFFRAVEYDASYISPWAVMYERRPARISELVREYDRAHARLRNEVQQLRQSILKLTDDDAGEDARRRLEDELEAREQLVRALQEQIFVMRDTVMGLEAKVGAIAGEREWYAAAAESREAAVKQLEQLLASRTWRAASRLLAPYRRVRGRLER